MKDDNLLCPVCRKYRFTEYCDYDICEYCGWENGHFLESGGADPLSLEDFKKRYQKYIELNPNYMWKKDGYPEITDKDEYRLAHKYCVSNETDVRNSKRCGCFFCFKTFSPDEITGWLSDKNGRTALCPYCGIDSVLPDIKIEFDRDFLEGMYKYWFE